MGLKETNGNRMGTSSDGKIKFASDVLIFIDNV